MAETATETAFEDLDEFFGTPQRGPAPKKCTICGEPSTVRLIVQIKEILRSEERDGKTGDGRSRQLTRAFCTEHGSAIYSETTEAMGG